MLTYDGFCTALKYCRRIFLMLMLALSVLASIAYWNAPSLDTVKPELESLLKQELQLDSLELGNLSWYWLGYIWVETDRISLTSRDGKVALENAELGVRIGFWRLVFGDFVPEQLRITDGSIKIDLTTTSTEETDLPALPGISISLENIHLTWKSPHGSGETGLVSASIDTSNRSCSVQTPTLRLNTTLDEGLLPEELKFDFSSTRELPASIRSHFDGDFSGKLELTRKQPELWQILVSLDAEKPVRLPVTQEMRFDFKSVAIEATLQAPSPSWTHFTPSLLRIKTLKWNSEKSNGIFNGQWQDGELKLTLQRGVLWMPDLWRWLKPLGGSSFHQWLDKMRGGRGHDLTGNLSFAWPELTTLPTLQQLADIRYHLTAKLSTGDIALGLGGDDLTDISALVEVNQNGLHASIEKAALPHHIGTIRGDLDIAWQDLLLNIHGQSTFRLARLQHWLTPDSATPLTWIDDASVGEVKIVWDPGKAHPDFATAVISPYSSWQATLFNTPIRMQKGKLLWHLTDGMQLKGMQVDGPTMHGVVDFTATHNWEFKSLQAKVEAELARLTSYYHIPIEQPEGRLQGIIRFGEGVSADFSLKQSGWNNLLGSNKKTGEPLSIHAQGVIEAHENSHRLKIESILPEGGAITFSGDGQLTDALLQINLHNLKAPAFDGDFALNVPFDTALPIELNVAAHAIDRNGFPTADSSDPTSAGSALPSGRKWNLHTTIATLTWNKTVMHDVYAQIIADAEKSAHTHIKRLQGPDLELSDIDANLSLTDKGVVDIRSASAKTGLQTLFVSGSMRPVKSGNGMHWNGFAQLSGDFGDLLSRSQLSTKFQGGKMQALLAGDGTLLNGSPWWQDIRGRLRLRSQDGRVLESAPLTKLLAITNLAELPARLLGSFNDLYGSGIHYHRLQLESEIKGKDISINSIVMRSSAMDMAGRGKINMEKNSIDLVLVFRPFQNLDAIIGAIPIVRDLFGGAARSLMRKIYRLHGPLDSPVVEESTPAATGEAKRGPIERLLMLPGKWFGDETEPIKLN